MCKLKSGVLLKDSVFVPEYDSHTDMLEELGIKDTRENAERLFVRAELLPPDYDVFAPVDTWQFHVDQDILPDWFVEEVDRQRMVEAVKEWAKDHVHKGVDGLKINSGSGHFIKDCKNIVICGNATVEYICGNATVKEISGNATVKEISGNATVEYAKGMSVIISSPHCWSNKDKLVITEDATFKDPETRTIYQAGDWTLKLV